MARRRSSSLGPLLAQASLAQFEPQQALAAGAGAAAAGAAAVSPAKQAVVINKNAAFTRFTSYGLDWGSGTHRHGLVLPTCISRLACALIFTVPRSLEGNTPSPRVGRITLVRG